MSQAPSVTLALLPFEVLSEEPADTRLATGFGHDLITEFARFPSLGVIAADSVSAAAGEGLDDAALAERLGTRFLMKGSFRRWENELRINVHLLEAPGGRHVWAGRYDGADLPAVHDDIAAKIVNALANQMDRSLLQSARRRHLTTLEAYECWLRGMECLQRGTSDSDEDGREFFRRAMELDPHYARAHVGVSLSHFNEWSCQTWGKWEEKENLAYDAAIQAEALDPDDAVTQLILGRIEQYRRQFDRADHRFERALSLAPNDAHILIQLCGSLTYQGKAALGWELGQRALELNPICPGWYFNYAAIPLVAMKRYEECLEYAIKAPPRQVVDAPAFMAVAAAYLGRTEDARKFLSEYQEDFTNRICCGRDPGPDEMLRWTLHVNPFRHEEDSRHLAEGLRKAGLEGSINRPTAKEPMPWPIANIFRKEGKIWTLSYEHQVVPLPDMRGLHDLARLLARPGEELASSELAAVGLQASGMEMADSQALKAYRERLREIEEEIETASTGGDDTRATALEEERETILKEVKRVTGLGGKTRKTGDAGERARSAVTWRIRHGIRKISEVHPALGSHLANSVRTGAFCSYSPEKLTSWQL